MECLFLDLRLVDFLAVQVELAVGVAEAVAIGGREVIGIEDVDAEVALVVDAFAGVQVHFDRYVSKVDSDSVDGTV